jgi:cellulose synthase/poly-beta-1,6-N-acetylglucosamine synthase-like glycosyltransferase
MTPSRLITVAIPTHNRAPTLRQTLERLTRLTVPTGVDWELIVVQNNCTDGTSDVLAELATRLPLRTLSESRPGVNYARNAAVDAAHGECIVFTDDDTLADEAWLSAYHSAFTSFSDVDVFGGPIIPRFACQPPPWLRDSLPFVAAAYGSREAGGRGVTLCATFFPFGANMAFRTSVLRKSPFDPTLGPKGKSRINGSETELILKLLAKGHAGRWVEDARVEHCIQAKQMTTKFLRWYFTGQGASMALTPPEPGTKMLWGRPRWLWREAASAELRYRARRLHASPETWVKALKRASIARGRLTHRGTTFA